MYSCFKAIGWVCQMLSRVPQQLVQLVAVAVRHTLHKSAPRSQKILPSKVNSFMPPRSSIYAASAAVKALRTDRSL